MTRASNIFDGSDASFNAFLKEFQAESDRAAAVLGVSMLDTLLETLVKNSVRDPAKAEDALLGTSRPLGAFSSRIDVAHAFGLLADEDATDLHLARRIRNAFAHGLHGMHFAHDKVRDLAGNFHCVRRANALDAHKPEWNEVFESPRARFMLAVAMLADWLDKLSKKAQRPTAPQSVGDYTEMMRTKANARRAEKGEPPV